MERHFSTGVSTIVALMAAHRTAAGVGSVPVRYSQEEIARIYCYLHGDEPPAEPQQQAVRRIRASILTRR
jgi:hypothetical protein